MRYYFVQVKLSDGSWCDVTNFEIEGNAKAYAKKISGDNNLETRVIQK